VHSLADELALTTNLVAVRKIWLLFSTPVIRDTFQQSTLSSLSSEFLSEKSTILSSSLPVDLCSTRSFLTEFYVRSFATTF
jgi:hypothetical protein